MKKILHQVNSIHEPHSFSGLPLSFGFLGKEEDSLIVKESFHHLKQVHGTRLVEASRETSFSCEEERPQGDALWTRKSGECVGVRTADCLPILVTDEEVSFVMGLHAGWRGLSAGIIPQCLERMKQEIPLRLEKLKVFMGPCIEKKAFEVGPEVVEAFRVASRGKMEASLFDSCCERGEGDRWFFSLKQFAFLSLIGLGVREESVSSLKSCTYHNQEKWFSYRRSGGKLAGYDWSWIKKL